MEKQLDAIIKECEQMEADRMEAESQTSNMLLVRKRLRTLVGHVKTLALAVRQIRATQLNSDNKPL